MGIYVHTHYDVLLSRANNMTGRRPSSSEAPYETEAQIKMTDKGEVLFNYDHV